jgi:hypothetical protein
MTTLQERRLAQARKSLATTRDTRERYIAMVARYTAAIKKLERIIARYERQIASPPKPTAVTPTAPPKAVTPTVAVRIEPPAPPLVAKPAPASGHLDPEMPDFLVRKPGEGDRKDAEAREAILAEQTMRKRIKSNNRVEKLKAKKRGDLKRMPASGRHAVERMLGETLSPSGDHKAKMEALGFRKL